MTDRYIVEVRDKNGHLDFRNEGKAKAAHPYLFSLPSFSIDQLRWYASYGPGRNNPTGPMQLGEFMESIGVSYRIKTW